MNEYEYLLPRILSNVSEDPSTGCWNWIGSHDLSGYGKLTHAGNSMGAHRLSFLAHGNVIPLRYVIDHLCRNPGCVNPKHLEAVTRRDNLVRGESRAGRSLRTNTCAKGHEFTPANTYVISSTRRRCRKCIYEAQKRYRARKKQVQR